MMLSISVRRLTTFGLITLAALLLDGCRSKADPRLATPKSAARTLFQAMYDNDVVTVRSCVIAGPGETEMAEGMTKMMVAMRGATDAAFNRYGDEFAKLAGSSLDTAHIDPKQIDAGAEKIDGESAAIVLQNGKATLHLVRQEGVWKVDMAQSFAPKANLADPQMMHVMTSMFSGMARAGDQTKAEIQAGKYPSARQAVQALMTTMRAAVDEEKNRAIKDMVPR